MLSNVDSSDFFYNVDIILFYNKIMDKPYDTKIHQNDRKIILCKFNKYTCIYVFFI